MCKEQSSVPLLEPRQLEWRLSDPASPVADYEWLAIKPRAFLSKRPSGLNGIFWVLRSGVPWRDLPEAFTYTTCYYRFVR